MFINKALGEQSIRGLKIWQQQEQQQQQQEQHT